LGIKFPEIKKLYEAVSIRHDIVHRSDKSKAEKEQEIGKYKCKI
jgi:hypothetical protein